METKRNEAFEAFEAYGLITLTPKAPRKGLFHLAQQDVMGRDGA